MKTKAFTLIELLIVCAIIALLAGIVVGSGGGCTRSEGVRIGTVTKFSYKGISAATKSWEGELLMGGLRQSVTADGVGTMANVWPFSVAGGPDSPLAKQINDSMGKPVKLHYRQSAFHNPAARNTSYYVTQVEDVSGTPEAK